MRTKEKGMTKGHARVGMKKNRDEEIERRWCLLLVSLTGSHEELTVLSHVHFKVERRADL